MADKEIPEKTITHDFANRLVKAASKYTAATRAHGIALHSLDESVRCNAAGEVYKCEKAFMKIVSEIDE